MKTIVFLLVLFTTIFAKYNTFMDYTICMAQRDRQSFFFKLKYECDQQCLGVFMKFKIRGDFSKNEHCVAARAYTKEDMYSVLMEMPGAEIQACNEFLQYPEDEQALAVIQAENKCIGIESQ